MAITKYLNGVNPGYSGVTLTAMRDGALLSDANTPSAAGVSGTSGGLLRYDATLDLAGADAGKVTLVWHDGTTPEANVILSFEITIDSFGNEVEQSNDAILTAVQSLNDLSTADIDSRVAAALATYDVPTKTELDTAVGALPTLSEFLAGGDVDGYTLEQTLRLLLAAMAGKVSGAASTTNTIRAADDSKDRITATVDSDGNRTALTLDAT